MDTTGNGSPVDTVSSEHSTPPTMPAPERLNFHNSFFGTVVGLCGLMASPGLPAYTPTAGLQWDWRNFLATLYATVTHMLFFLYNEVPLFRRMEELLHQVLGWVRDGICKSMGSSRIDRRLLQGAARRGGGGDGIPKTLEAGRGILGHLKFPIRYMQYLADLEAAETARL